MEFSDHAAKSITELEVFTGNIFNKSGVQTRRQRDRSVQLKDEFDRISRWAEAMIRKRKMRTLDDDDEDEQPTPNPEDALVLSIACLQVGTLKDLTRLGYRRLDEEFQSFKVTAACCVIRELDAAIPRREWETASGGVYVN